MIPTVGARLRLSENWTFVLHIDRQNSKLIDLMGYGKVELTAGTSLTISSTHLSTGAPTFEFITFTIEDSPQQSLNGCRFWATLEDVSSGLQCEYEPDPFSWDIEYLDVGSYVFVSGTKARHGVGRVESLDEEYAYVAFANGYRKTVLRADCILTTQENHHRCRERIFTRYIAFHKAQDGALDKFRCLKTEWYELMGRDLKGLPVDQTRRVWLEGQTSPLEIGLAALVAGGVAKKPHRIRHVLLRLGEVTIMDGQICVPMFGVEYKGVSFSEEE
jgi:hypothetical protein